MLHKPSDISFKKKYRVVRKYLTTGQSLRKIADANGIPYKTIWFWVKLYKEGGTENLAKSTLNKKRIPRDIEKQVMFLKERNPSLSMKKARQLMNKSGIQISIKGIWAVWRKHGFVNKQKQDPLGVFCTTTPELERAIEVAKTLVERQDFKGAAKILNEIPRLPECQLLMRIPEGFLTLRRKLERLRFEYGQISFTQFSRKARQLGKSLEKKGYVYSSMIANFLESDALGWLGKIRKKSEVLRHLAEKMRGVKDSALWFLLYLERASSYAQILQITKSLEFIKKCRRLIYRFPYRLNYWESLGNLLTNVGKYSEAFFFYKKVFENEKNPEAIERLALKMAIFGHSYAGRYSDCKKMLTKVQVLKSSPSFGATYSLVNAYLSFGQGNLADASKYFLESLEKAQEGKLHNRIYAASVGLSAVATALNKKSEARIYLQKYLPLVKKYKLVMEEVILRYLINPAGRISEKSIHMPSLYLLNLLLQVNQTMKIGDYRKALNFAQRKGLLGLFHRWIIFFPEPILRFLEKGKKTGLPRAILNFPVFNQKIPVYHIKLLGKLVVTKNQEYLKARLSPKEKAFLIHLALKAGAPRKSILLKDLYENFWPRSRNPSSLLLHLLVRLKKKLRLSGYLLSISSKSGVPKLVNRGIYVTTDYQEFETLLVQVNSLERADEWQLTKREYLRAFVLFRGEPFKKMYDPWSEHMRRVILNRLETEALHFAKSCLGHNNEIRQKKRRTPSAKCRGGNMVDVKKVLEKVSKIIPNSEEIKRMVRECGGNGVSEKRK